MKIQTTNLRTILEAIGESKTGDILQVLIDSPRETDLPQTVNVIKKQYPYTFFTFECFKSKGQWWLYVYVRSMKEINEDAA